MQHDVETPYPDPQEYEMEDAADDDLVIVLVTGMLPGDAGRVEQREPAGLNVFGDPNVAGITYRHIAGARDYPANEDGALVHDYAFVDTRRGSDSDYLAVTSEPERFDPFGVTATMLPDSSAAHCVASVFLNIFLSAPDTDEDGQDADVLLAEEPDYTTGRPITEPYWVTAVMDGEEKDVLLQCFERVCLAYVPDNPEGQRVEAGNVEQHFDTWRDSAGATATLPHPPAAEEQPRATGNIAITNILYDSPVPREHSGEFVTLTNKDNHPVQMQGWRLTDEGDRHQYTFPEFVLQPGASVNVRTCRGQNTDTDLYTGRCNPWWNNDGDTGYLYDARGTLVDTYTYTPERRRGRRRSPARGADSNERA
jgi:hypothetical protein